MRRLLAFSLALLALGVSAAEPTVPFPTKPIHLLVGYAPGGSADYTARVVGERLSKIVGQPVIVENRAGAAQNIAGEAVAKATPDGYTLLFIGTSLAINPALYPKMPFDVLHDFAAVGGVVTVPLLVAVPANSPALDIAGLVAAAKTKPGALNYGSSGNGSLTNLSVEIFKNKAGISMTHVPYRGSGPMLTAMIGGEINAAFDVMSSAYPLVKGGKLRALAVTSARRMSLAPNIPTLDEAGYPGLGLISWYGIVAPSKTPPDIIKALNLSLQKVLANPDTRAVLAASGSDPMPGTPQAFQAFFGSEVQKWGREVIRLGVTLD